MSEPGDVAKSDQVQAWMRERGAEAGNKLEARPRDSALGRAVDHWCDEALGRRRGMQCEHAKTDGEEMTFGWMGFGIDGVLFCHPCSLSIEQGLKRKNECSFCGGPVVSAQELARARADGQHRFERDTGNMIGVQIPPTIVVFAFLCEACQ